MCRYAMTSYKPHYACFSCRKVFKRRLMVDVDKGNEDHKESKCPQCSELMANMGLDFAAPKKGNLKAWEHLKKLYTVGITFHSCGCGGPGFIPRDKAQLKEHFERILKEYNQHLNFWRKRTEPSTKPEIDRDKSKSFDYITRIPYENRSTKGKVLNDEAKQYWIDRIKDVETRLNKLD